MIWEVIAFYLSSYLIAYLLLKGTEMGIQKYSEEEFQKLGKDVWIRYYCVLVVFIIHFIWIHCHFTNRNTSFHICFDSKHKHQNLQFFIFPLLFLTPIYIIFFYNYYDYQWGESSSQENEKINRILSRIMILLFIITFLFIFLSHTYQKRTMDLVTILSVFELF
jgi:magnesium-transporting ATPase (P-type)